MKMLNNKIIHKFLKLYKDFPIQLRASVWFLICSVLQKGITLVTTPIFTRMFNTTEYGKYSVFISWENIIIVFVSLSLSAGVYQQGLVKYEDDRDKYSSSLIGLTMVLFCAWGFVYLLFKDFFNSLFSMKTSYMVLMFVMMFLGTIFNFWSNKERVQYRYKLLILFSIIASILNPVLGIVFMRIFKDKVFGRILGICLAYVVSYTWMMFSLLNKGKSFYSSKYWGNALKFNIPLIPHYLSQVVLSGSDRIMIEKMVSLDSAGIYNLAYSISLIMILVNSALMQTLSPWILKKIKDKKISDIGKISYLSMIIIAIANIMLICIAPEVVKIFAPMSYYEAIYAIPPIAISVYFIFCYDLFAKFEFYYEKTKLITFATISGAVLNLILNYIFIPKYGYFAAAYTTLFCYILYSVFHYIAMSIICKKNLDGQMPFKLNILLLISIIFVILGFSLMFLYNLIIIRYFLILIIIIIIFVKRNKLINLFKEI